MATENDYTLEMEDRGTYLYALAGGRKLTAEISAEYWDRIAERCFELERDRILIEKDFVESVGPEDMLAMATHLGQLLPTWKIAFIDRHRHGAINELGKKLARNRDVMMQLFDNVQDAERWLLAN